MTANDEILGSDTPPMVKRDGKSQVAVLVLIGRTVPVVVFAAAAVVAWCANSNFLCVLSSVTAALYSLQLGLHFVLWRLECRRAKRRDAPEGSTPVFYGKRQGTGVAEPGR